MTKKKILYMYVISISVTTIIFILSVGVSFKKSPAQAAPISTSTSSSVGYILGEYDGQLALYRSDSSSPYKKLSYNISMLTEYDREQVLNGIYVDTEAELNALIEDLTS